jgi:pilus assembly protein CpaE
MNEVARVVLALEGHEVAEEVMHFLDRSGCARVVATASDERQLAEAVRQLEPDAVVAAPGLAAQSRISNGPVLLALDTSESVRSLREAIGAGASGFFVWPADRDGLAQAAARALPPADPAEDRRGRVVAVYGARGGVGATFLAAHLAAAMGRRRLDCVLVDLDLAFADISAAVGAPSDEPTRTIADVVPLVDELTDQHLDGILWRHPEGFRLLLAPGDAESAALIEGDQIRAAVQAVRRLADVVVLHIPRGFGDVARAGLQAADRVIVVLQLDVLSFRAARRAIGAAGVEERCLFVVNRAARAQIVPRDVERVFGRPPTLVIPVDRAVPRAQDKGRLLPSRSRTGRAVGRLAALLLEEAG